MGKDEVGGLVGQGESARIFLSYADIGCGSRRRADDVGGLAGDAEGRVTHRTNIISSYVQGGRVEGTGDDVGGLVGMGQKMAIRSSPLSLRWTHADEGLEWG